MDSLCIRLIGDQACFTRPESKAERISYKIPTPSAARGIIENIYWKPVIKYNIHKISVVNPIKYDTLKTNELKNKMNPNTDGYYIEDQRTQRISKILRDVDFLIHFTFEMNEAVLKSDKYIDSYNKGTETHKKHLEILKRRLEQGQNQYTPYFGCKNFSIKKYELVNPKEIKTIDLNEDLGMMLYGLDYTNKQSPKPLFFHAIMEHGNILVPPPNSKEVFG